MLLQNPKQTLPVLLVGNNGENVFDAFGGEGVMCDQFGDVGLGLGVPLRAEDADYLEASMRPDVLLVVRDFEISAERLETDQQFIGYLREVVEDQEDALLHGVHEGPSDVLELSELLLADEVTQQTVEFHRPVHPDLDVLSRVVLGEVVDGQDAPIREGDVQRVVMVAERFLVVSVGIDLLLDGLLQSQHVVEELPQSQTVLRGDGGGERLSLVEEVPVGEGSQAVQPQTLLVAACLYLGHFLQFQSPEVNPRDEADDVEGFQQECGVDIGGPVTGSGDELLQGSLHLLVGDGVAEADECG